MSAVILAAVMDVLLLAQASLSPVGEWVRTALEEAHAAAVEIEDPYHRAQALAQIAEAEVVADQADRARETLEKAAAATGNVRMQPLAAWALHDIAFALAKTDDLAGAEATAERITDSTLRDAVLAHIAEAHRTAGDLVAAIAAARKISNTERQGRALREVVSKQISMGDLAGALLTARSIVHGQQNALALGDVAIAEAKEGNLEVARSLAMRIRDTAFRARALSEIAAAQAEGGDVAGAMKLAEEIREPLPRAEAFARIAAVRSRRGTNSHEAFAYALRTAQSARSSPARAVALIEIARAQVSARDFSGARETLSNAVRDVSSLREGELRVSLLGRIVPLQARCGAYAQALAVARQVTDPSLRPLLMRDVVAIQAESGDVDGAIAAARGISDPQDAVAAFFGILRIQSQSESASEQRKTVLLALEKARQISNPAAHAGALGALAAALMATGDAQTAQMIFDEARSSAASAPEPQQRAAAYARIADAVAPRNH